MHFRNIYEDDTLAAAYSRLEFANTYFLAYRDVPSLIRAHVCGTKALDFGCGTGRSSRFLRGLGFEVIGVDISAEMLAQAHALDPEGDYRLLPGDDFSSFASGSCDLVLSMFTFDNVPSTETKVRIFGDLRRLLKPAGRLVSVVSSPAIYLHEWASFSTKDFPENRAAKSGDVVRIVTTELADRRPTEDILFTDESYRAVYERAGLDVVAVHKPLAQGNEPYVWINETTIPPWVVYVLAPAADVSGSG